MSPRLAKEAEGAERLNKFITANQVRMNTSIRDLTILMGQLEIFILR
jgi:hypothetical protein